MQRSFRVAVLVTVLLLSVAVWVVPAEAGTYTLTYKDTFSSKGYAGNDGTATFIGAWQEIGEKDGPENGKVLVYESASCVTAPCLKLWGTSLDAGYGVSRTMDTGGATDIKICFDYRRQLIEDPGDTELQVEVKGSGTGWQTVMTIPLDRSDTTAVHVQRDISGFAATDMGIRFRTSGGGSDVYLFIDNVEVQATWVETTTTVPSTTTTTVAPGTTSTTEPPTTTTTSPTGTTTTTEPGGTTTTTEANGTTTSTPPIGTTTTTATIDPAAMTTTTAPAAATVVPTPPDQGGGSGDVKPVPLTPEELAAYSSKASMSLDDAMPMLMVPSMDEPDGAGAGTTGSAGVFARTPTEGLMATFSTSSETFKAHGLSVVLLGVLVAWLAVRGLGRSRWIRKDPVNVTS